MGNGGSKEELSTPAEGGGGVQDQQSAAKDEHKAEAKKPRRRDSIHVPYTPRASAVPPSASLDTAQGQSSSSTGTRISHARGRSQTTANPPTRSMLGSDEAQVASEAQHSLPTRSAHAESHTSPNIAIPHPADPKLIATEMSTDESDLTSPGSTVYQTAHFGRPPRLPLPIQEEVLSPGSPIISPADVSSDEPLGDDIFARNPSMLSSTTVDDDDQGELGEEFRDPDNKDAPAIDTKLTWRGGGKDVYITGSFSRWNKKWRMHRIAEGSDVFERTLPLPPGVHHLTFVVDGEMKRSNELPTAVDYTNYLVNYIDVHLDPIPEDTLPSGSSYQTTPQPTPAAENEAPPLEPAEVPPATPEMTAQQPSEAPSTTGEASEEAPRTRVVRRQERRAYHREIPRFLAHLDEPEESSRFHRASTVLGTQPAPPSLPMFLNKSILNGATPMKDDASVLIMPNHTVLNHLATSSIKHNVLATSGTTRYKRKFLTTILYKPTNDNGD